MRKEKFKSLLSLLLVFLLMIGMAFVAIVGVDKDHTGSARNIKLGLDLSGGVSITYQVKDKNPTEKEMEDTIYKLQKRVENYSTEAAVYQEGKDRISIEIPGVTNANEILDDLGKPGSLSFVTEEGTEILSGADIKNAKVRSGEGETGNTQYSVELSLNEEGKEKFAQATSENVGRRIAIVYDQEVISAPTVEAEITGGVAYITGDFTYEEAEELASSIRIGGLKLELEELSSNVVGAQLGSQVIQTSLKAGIVGILLVFLFMVWAYLLPGVASSIALLIYTELVLLILNAFDVTLTLPGVAGIILGIGMAVDANVIIFARVREEMTKGRSVEMALGTGFRKATSAIVDGNVTTLIAALVLWMKGSGPVKGFAQTLGIGILVSMFTALVITKWIIYSFYHLGLKNTKIYYKPKKERQPIEFLEKRKAFFAASLAVILIGVAVMGIQSGMGKGAFNYSLEFKGGTAITADLEKDCSIEQIEKEILPVVKESTGVKNVQAQKVSGSEKVVLKTDTLSLKQREKLSEAFEKELGVTEVQTENISSTISKEMRQDAIIAVLIATICMLLYIWIRFKDLRFAASAVLALFHDVLIVLAFYAVSRISVGSTFIACMLTLVGYSINATIVIFDRIREEYKGKDLAMVVNRSITQTLTRTVYTSLTTFIMVFLLFAFGAVREFTAPLMVGIICGGYSSVCITGALWYIMKKPCGKKK